ncbi:rab-GTPase-TBC domain-containing protein [Gautieria morchelliformis]|nr:rab-GTPase-TBC domain-containing protein [Gautieria morchelliformis]
MKASPRPPPTRPHVGINTPSHFPSYSSADWGEDDAWDSASDHDSPVNTTSAQRSSSAVSVPRRPNADRSNSTLSFSYTHLTAPSPSSYPSSQPISNSPPSHSSDSKAGWTIVRTEQEVRKSRDAAVDKAQGDTEVKQKSVGGDVDVEGDMIVGELEQDQELLRPRCGKESIRSDAGELVNDPLYSLRNPARRREARSPSPSRHTDSTASVRRERSIRTNRRRKFEDCLLAQDVNIAELRKLAWSGVPDDLRPIAWQLLLGYLPLPTPLRISTLTRKREEYESLVQLAFARGRDGLDQQIWHQIEIDVPRTRPGIRLWMEGGTQRSLERILYVWAIRHPASGYVQGINDLVTPFFQIFLSAYIGSDPEQFDPSLLPPNVLNAIEADSFWCLSRLLDGIQDNYIFAQPGIQRSVKRMADLVARIDAPLSAHLEAQNVEFMQFAFRWMNCLLMREISVRNTIRMWDTYLAEGPEAFSQFHLYVCSAFLVKWSEKLRDMDFQGIIMFLQSLPTQEWTDHDVELLLSEAFLLNSVWHHAQSHFSGK